MRITPDQLVQNLSDSGLMTADEASSLCSGLSTVSGPTDSDTVIQELVGSGRLTAFQAECICRGEISGLVFDEYVVLDKIGQGGMGVVLKAHHGRMRRTVAVKKLPPGKMDTEGAVERFYREVQAAARLSHPNIVTAHDAREHDGIHYLIMEYVDGPDLAQVVQQRGPLPLDEAVDYIVQAARGLAYAHSQGVIHRDIKPANLLLATASGGHPPANSGRKPTGISTNQPADAGRSPSEEVPQTAVVKILDMGLALIKKGDGPPGTPDSGQLTSDGQVMGTCDYMAPEQAKSTHDVDHRADIYALGCTLYRILTGEPPYRADSLFELLVAHQEAEIPSLCDKRPDVPQAVDAVYRRMVAKTPEERYSSMNEVIAALEAALPGKSPEAASALPDPDSNLEHFFDHLRGEPAPTAEFRSPVGPSEPAATGTATKPRTAAAKDETIDDTPEEDTNRSVAQPAAAAPAPTTAASRRSPTKRRQRTRMLLWISIGLGLSLLGAAVLATVIYVQTDDGTIVVDGQQIPPDQVIEPEPVTIQPGEPLRGMALAPQPAADDEPQADAASYRPPVIEPELVRFFAQADLYKFLAAVVNDKPSDFMLRLLYTEIAATMRREHVGSWRIGPGMTRDGSPYEFSVRNTRWFARKLSAEEAKEMGISGRSWGRTLNVMWSNPVNQIMSLESADVRIETDGDGNRALVGRIGRKVDTPQRVDYLSLVFNTPSPEEGENVTRNLFQYVRPERLPGDVFEVHIPLGRDQRIPEAGRFYFQAFLFEPQASFYRISNELVWAGPPER